MIHIRIKLQRVQKFMSQKEIAKKLFITQSAYCKIEKGITKVDFERILQLAVIFKIDPSVLIGP